MVCTLEQFVVSYQQFGPRLHVVTKNASMNAHQNAEPILWNTMSRQRAFDKEHVLEQAMNLFWSRGYEATSVRDLTTATGISSSSMYEFFGDKRALYLAALARYCLLEQAIIAATAEASATPRDFLFRLFPTIDQYGPVANVIHGSFAFQAMVEFGVRDEAITSQLFDHYMQLTEIITQRLTQAQAAGQLNPTINPKFLARTLLSSLHGVATLMGVKPDAEYSQGVLETLLRLFD
jgi:TetR/AcrR family transcriptional regulator, transcriptional repressor for nem operon